MHLDELAIRVVRALLVDRSLGRAGADDGVGAFAEDSAYTACGQDDGIGVKGANFHAAQVHGADTAANSIVVENRGEEFPAFVLLDLAFGLVAADLLIECVKQLLSSRSACKSSAME